MGRRIAAAVGAGITVFLIIAVSVIELLNMEFSAIIGLPVGLLAGAATAVIIATRYHTLAPIAQYMVDAAAGFGLAMVALLAVSYVNPAGLRSTLSSDVTVGIAVLAAVVAAFVSWRTTE